MSEPMIIIEPCAGLGNRLLGLGSAYAVAEKLNRRLVVMSDATSVFQSCLICRLRWWRSAKMDLRMSRWHSFLGIMQKRNGEKWQIVS